MSDATANAEHSSAADAQQPGGAAPAEPQPREPRQRRAIADLAAGDRLEDETFLILQKDLRTTNNGGLYIHAVLGDHSGQLLSRMWNASREIYASLPDHGVVHVRGRVESYKGRPQFIIDGVRAAEPGRIDPSEFLPKSAHDVGEMWERVKRTLRTIRNPSLLALLAKFVNDEPFAESFRKAPAARTNHHAYLGGLLEHTQNLLALAEVVLPRYPRVSRDLVLAGLFLHDAGKTVELSYQNNFDYTDEGQLLGHVVQGAVWIAEKARQVELDSGQPFPHDLLIALQHVIVSHHGRYEFGSPRLPATAEAIMVHYLDNLDAKLAMVFEAIDADEEPQNDWTKWVPALETRVYKPYVT